MFKKFLKAKSIDDEREAFEALMAIGEEEDEPRMVEPVNEAYPVDVIGEAKSNMRIIKTCNPEFIGKIIHVEPIEAKDIPDYIYEDLCKDIGERMLKNCAIEYSINAMTDEIRVIAKK